MCFMRKKEGFTLIELLIVILTGSVVTMAATTVLLLAFRINHKSLDTIKSQSVLRIMLSVLEDMSSDGEYVLVNNWELDEDGNPTQVMLPSGPQEFWSINKENATNPPSSTPLITYNPPMGMDSGKIIANGGQTLVDDISSSRLYKPYTPFKYVRDLYTFSVEIEGRNYESTVYSRTQEKHWQVDDPLVDYEDNRKVLMEVVSSQIGSVGLIMDEPDTSYAEWYSDKFAHWDETDLAYVEANAWCGCFVSWAINEVNNFVPDTEHLGEYEKYITPEKLPQEANVNFLWLECFAQSGADSLHVYGDGYVPQPGDLVFFTDYSEHGTESLDNLRNLSETLDNIAADEMYDTVQHELSLEKNSYYIHVDYDDYGVETDEDYCMTESAYNLLVEAGASPEEYYEPYSVLEHFLDVTGDGVDHVGIVVKVCDGYVYTVEGNFKIAENSQVVMRKHPLENVAPDASIYPFLGEGEYFHIFGYATLNWLGNP